MPLQLSEKSKRRFEWLLTRYPTREAVMLPALRLVEEEFGEISNDGMALVADLLQVPAARVLGVLTFYTHYRRQGTGRHLVQVCATLPCALRGCESLFDHVAEKVGVRKDGTTPDGRFTLKKVECLASCDTAPVIQINDDYHENLTPEKIDQILDGLK